METGSIGRYCRFVIKCALVLALLFSGGFLIAWLLAPSLIEDWFTEAMAEEGVEAGFTVELGSRNSTISDLFLRGDGVDLQVGEIWANYDWGLLTKGWATVMVAREVALELDLDELLAEAEESEPSLPLENKIRRWSNLPIFRVVRIEETHLGLTFGGARSELSLVGRLDASVRPHLAIECNSSLGELDLEINQYGLGVGLSAGLRMSELVKPAQFAHTFLGDRWPAGLEVLGGKLEAQVGTRVKGDSLIHGVIHATIENLSVMLPRQEENGTRWPASATALTVVATEDNGSWRTKLGGDFMVGSFLQLDDVALVADTVSDQAKLSIENADGRLTLPEYQIDFAGLSAQPPIDLSNPWKQGQAVQLGFAELRYGGDEFVLYDGVIHLALEGEDDPVSVRLPPCYALMPATQVAFEGLSFEGALATLANPVLTAPQTVRCDRVMLAEEPALEDLEMIFRVDGNDTILVDFLGFETNGKRVEVRPELATFALTGGGGAILELNATTIEFPDEELVVDGVTGTVLFDSIDPLVIGKAQELVFAKATFGDMQWGPGRVAFSLDRKGVFSLEPCEGDFLGGALRLELASFDLFAEKSISTFAVVLEDVVAEQVVSLMPGFEGELRGLLSGSILLSDRDGDWNYLDGGHLELAADPKGYLSYPTDGLLTEGMDPKSSNFKRSRILELALQDLEVEKLRLEFLEDLSVGRLIKGEVLGESMVGKKKIKVTYRPEIKGDLVALLHQLEFAGFSFD